MKKLKIFKDKEGNKLTFKEFITKWKVGIEGITPSQKIKTQIGGTRIMLIGLFLGLCVSIYGWKNLWWVGIILIGALLNTGVQYLGLKQQRKILDNIEEQFKEPEEPQDNSPLGQGQQEKLPTPCEGVLLSKPVGSSKELDKIVKENRELTGLPPKEERKDPLLTTKEIIEEGIKIVKEEKEVKPIILDDNLLSMASYAEEFPENFKEISNSLDKEKDKEVKQNG